MRFDHRNAANERELWPKLGNFKSLVDLQTEINRFIDRHNTNEAKTNEAKPFRWTADPDKIIAAVKRGRQALKQALESEY